MTPNLSSDSSAAPPASVVARYTAVVSGRIERSELQIVDQAGLTASRPALEADPGFAPWPAHAVRLSDEGLVAARLKALFDFGAQLPDGDDDTTTRAMHQRWPLLKKLKGSEALERIEVTALVRADGTAEWGFERSDANRAALPIPDGEVVVGRPELDLYVQNMVRRGLRRRIR